MGELRTLPGGRRKANGLRKAAQALRAKLARERARRLKAPAPPVPPVDHLAPPRAGAPPGKPRPGGKRTRAPFRYPPLAGRAGEAGGACSRAACSRTSPGSAASVPPPARCRRRRRRAFASPAAA